MEGAGSRLGRASSRYGPATLFSGPVRKWKKQWVHVSSSSSSSSTVSYQSTHGHGSRSHTSNGNTSNTNASSLLLCRWTPVPPNTNTTANFDDNNSVMPEEPPRRKFRYTPIVVLEEQKREAAEKEGDRTKMSTVHTTFKSDDAYGKPNTEGAFMEEIQSLDKKTNGFVLQAARTNQLGQQDSNVKHLNLDLSVKDDNGNNESDGGNKESKDDEESSSGFVA